MNAPASKIAEMEDRLRSEFRVLPTADARHPILRDALAIIDAQTERIERDRNFLIGALHSGCFRDLTADELRLRGATIRADYVALSRAAFAVSDLVAGMNLTEHSPLAAVLPEWKTLGAALDEQAEAVKRIRVNHRL